MTANSYGETIRGETPDEKGSWLAQSVEIGSEFRGFTVWIVGGAVRDTLRETLPTDIDLAVHPQSHSDPVAELERRSGMTRVDTSSAFPVFIDGDGREVALLRSEWSGEQEFHDFEVSLVSPDVPADDAIRTDLSRRDLTMNAIAVNARTGELLDPHGGVEDISESCLRHVSDAFSEDPIRVLRVGRYAPRFQADVAPETVRVARETASELHTVTQDRITDEFRKTLTQAHSPGRFFRVLSTCGALTEAFPSVEEEQLGQIESRLKRAKSLLGSVPRVLWVVLGATFSSDSRDQFVSNQDIRNTEKRLLTAGRFAEELTTIETVPPEMVIHISEVLVKNGGITPVEAIATGQALASDQSVQFNPSNAGERLQKGITTVRQVGGTELMEEDNIHPGDDVSGEEFGELVTQKRIDYFVQNYSECC